MAEEEAIQELKARLEFVEMQRKEEVAITRANILRKKQERVDTLTRKAEYLRHVRQLSAAHATARRAATAAEAQAAAAAAEQQREERVVQVAEKLTDKRRAQAEERAQQAAEAKRVAFLQQQQAAGASEVWPPACRAASGRTLHPAIRVVSAAAWRRRSIPACPEDVCLVMHGGALVVTSRGTLLHAIGDVVDWRGGCVGWQRSE